MAVGTVSTRILTDIANAILYQAGVATTYKPREIAATRARVAGDRAAGRTRRWLACRHLWPYALLYGRA